MPSAWTTGDLAARIGATCEGPTDRLLRGVAALDRAGPDELTFCRGGRWARALAATRAGAVLVPPDLPVPPGTVALRSREPRYAYAVAAALLVPIAWPAPGVHPTARVDPTATVGEGVTIEPFAVVSAGAVIGDHCWLQGHSYIGRDSVLGARCRVMPGAVVMERCRLGDRVWLHPGAVVGADGFGHEPGASGIVRVPQLGVAVLEDDVEVGANACVDRAALDETRIGRGTRLDNLVQVAHGVRIGSECLLAAFAGVAGGARLGDRVVMAGRTAVVDGIEVGDGAVFAGLASASRDVPRRAKIGGSPARSYRRWLRELAGLRQLPGLIKQVERLARRVDRIDSERAAGDDGGPET
ncbi:MAG: UDP-3-O-(3-hydroxymyristoyl)glucosamine N-acyltransferase [Myxococcota bacterium]